MLKLLTFRERVHQHMALLKGRQLNKRLCAKGRVQITPPILQTDIINCLGILESLPSKQMISAIWVASLIIRGCASCRGLIWLLDDPNSYQHCGRRSEDSRRR